MGESESEKYNYSYRLPLVKSDSLSDSSIGRLLVFPGDEIAPLECAAALLVARRDRGVETMLVVSMPSLRGAI